MERSARGRNIATNVTHFSKRLKTHLFRQSYPVIVPYCNFCIHPHSGFEVALLLRPL